ncbi:hypothetical protein G7046_g1820 [Stylonectria norvegica]|nr:hypothetical protein G7046_g1820 [Stylonectria norvegica]
MQLTCIALGLGSLATLAAASARSGFEFPDSVPLSRRQTSGPVYECHSNCGYTIIDAKDAGYCDSAEWNKLFEACLACANQYDIWEDYGDGVKAAAEGCGLDATPLSAEGDSSSSAAAASTTRVVTSAMPASMSLASTTVAPDVSPSATVDGTLSVKSSTVEKSSAVVETTAAAVTSITASTSAASISSAMSTMSASSNTTTSAQTISTAVAVSGGPGNVIPHSLVVGAILLAVISCM